MILLLFTSCTFKVPAVLSVEPDTQGSSFIKEISKPHLVAHAAPKNVPRFEYKTDCEENVDILYIARQSASYNRVDEYCISTDFEDKLFIPTSTSTPSCNFERCGFTTGHKGYLIEPAILESLSGAARIKEIKQSTSVSKFNEQTNDATLQRNASSTITKFALNKHVHCASKLTSSSNKFIGKNLYTSMNPEWRDHSSERTIYFKMSHTENEYSLLAHFNRTFSHKGSDLHIEEVISCQSHQPFSLQDTNHLLEVIDHTDYLWGIYTSPNLK